MTSMPNVDKLHPGSSSRDTGETASSAGDMPSDDFAWLEAFKTRNGRPLRVLHVGNIANNAYLNAKMLRKVGVEADVLSYHYNHVMALPEWEDVELRSGHGDDNNPRFSPQDLEGYQRPDWFFHGALASCIRDIETRYGWREPKEPFFRRMAHTPIRLIDRWIGPRPAILLSMLVTAPRLTLIKAIRYVARRHFGSANWRSPPLAALARWLEDLDRAARAAPLRGENDAGNGIDAALVPGTPEHFIAQIMEDFRTCFPERPDRPSREEIVPYYLQGRILRAAFKHYDIVQCYATEPLHALLNGTRPYVAFEHGTLRDFTMGDNPVHRMTALAYRQADHAFITNGDCLDYARRLEIPRYSPIIHPVDVEQHRQDFGSDLERLRDEIGGDVILFCPIRHDWAVKGTDVHLRALPLIKQRTGKRIRLVLARWGAQLADSEQLLSESGCSEDVIWRPSMCRITMIKYLRVADVVLDQMALPHFGATAPQALAAGTPVISSYEPESTRWIVPEPAPILPAFSPEDVAQAVLQALDPAWRAGYKERARLWTDAYHHPDNVIRDHLKAYRRILDT